MSLKAEGHICEDVDPEADQEDEVNVEPLQSPWSPAAVDRVVN